MTDQTLNQATDITAAPVKTLLARVWSHLTSNQSATPCLDLSPSDRAHLDRGLPTAKRLRQDIGVPERMSRHDKRNNVADLCARNGLPL